MKIGEYIEELHKKVDSLIETIDQSKESALKFKESYQKDLENKNKFYKE